MGNQTSSSLKIGREVEENWPYVWAIRDPEVLDWRSAFVAPPPASTSTAEAEVGGTSSPPPPTASNETTASAGASVLQRMSADDIQAMAIKQAQLPVEIASYLYLSDAKSVRDVPTLKKRGITHVLNVAGPSAKGPLADYENAGIEYLQIDADDEEGYDMLGLHLEEAQAFVAKARASEGGKCAIHCHAGINRSGVLVAAIYMLDTNTDVLGAVAHCRMQRGNAFLWNHSFQSSLVALARERGLLGARPGDEGSRVPNAAPPPPEPLGPPPIPQPSSSGAGSSTARFNGKPRPAAALSRLM